MNSHEDVGSAVVKIKCMDKKMADIELPDPEDPMILKTDATAALESSSNWKSMEALTDPAGAFLGSARFNYR